jgi:Asp-tRNA(Asn)/Glu-tRNA(Gln) amidotransferase A subunit family amidase
MAYDRSTVHAPRLAGLALSAVASLVDNKWSRALLTPRLLEGAGIAALRRTALAEAPMFTPPMPAEQAPLSHPSVDIERLAKPRPSPGYPFETIADFALAYREGRITPEQVAERSLAAIEDSNRRSPPVRAVITVRADDVRAQARRSAERHRAGQALGPLDGVPVAVKEELDVAGYATTAGTSFLHTVAAADATAVARLRAAGAVIVGKANMHEIGIDVTGFNAHHGSVRNPYKTSHDTGGSSSGSAAAVAAGLVPLAVGADGGGSIRIPAALNGVVGLKPTFGRISEKGAYPLCWTVAHVGPLGATADDVAIGYSLMGGVDDADPNTERQPLLELGGYEDDMTGLRLGVHSPWFDDAAPEVVRVCREALAVFEARGARVVEIDLPGLDLCRVAHGITILAEMATAMDAHMAEHRADFGATVRLLLALAEELTARDYVRAQQVRARFFRTAERALSEADVIVSPATGLTAPVIAKGALSRGESNLVNTTALMRYAFPWNLTGHPAVSFPVGHDRSGLPIGMQVVGRPWSEALLLRFARIAGTTFSRARPEVSYRLLE